MNQTTEQKIDCVVRVVTPENIEFEYLLAGPFQRLPAFVVDFAVRASIFILLLLIGAFIGVPLVGSWGILVTWVLGFLAFFVLSWLYGTLMETHFNGRTIGKIIFGLRVISSDGRPINGSQAALRNLLRLSDFMPPLSLALLFPDAPPANIIPTCFVGLLTMTLTARMQRLGDLAASTMVVWDSRRGLKVNLQPEDARAYALAELIPPTFQINRTLARVVALYMERRRYLSQQRRHEIAANLAQPLLALFELLPDTSYDLLLCALYVRIYHSKEQRAARLAVVRALQGTKSMPSAFTHTAVPFVADGTSSTTLPGRVTAMLKPPTSGPGNTAASPQPSAAVSSKPLDWQSASAADVKTSASVPPIDSLASPSPATSQLQQSAPVADSQRPHGVPTPVAEELPIIVAQAIESEGNVPTHASSPPSNTAWPAADSLTDKRGSQS